MQQIESIRSGFIACVLPKQDYESEAYKADMAVLHAACARRLLRLCQSNGGVYIKAAQLLSTAQTAPMEYRRYAHTPSRHFQR